MTEQPHVRTVSRSVEIAASPQSVWALVSDLPAMGRFSDENNGGRWTGGATGPAVGARFTGRNSRGKRSWSTSVEVTACEPGRAFAFDVTSAGLGVARWSYLVEPVGAGCRVTETWEDRRGWLVRTIGGKLTGVSDRATHAAASMQHTLDAVKAHAEG